MEPVVTVAEMRAVDEEAARRGQVEDLVARAGRAVAGCALSMLGGAYGRRVLVLAGPGNNGADGRVAADVLARRGARVTVEAPTRAGGDPGRGDPGVPGTGPAADPAAWRLPPVDLVIDAAYGTGLRGGFAAPLPPPGARVLAVDIPSGVEGDSGVARGAPMVADRTVTFAAWKPGLLQGDGPDYAGDVSVADIGLRVARARIHVVEDRDVVELVPRRARDDNKWSSAVMVVAGSPGMAGAAHLCVRAAFRTGSGMVRLAVPGMDPAAVGVDEAVSVACPDDGWAERVLEEAARCSAVVIGPGLGRADSTGAQVRRVVAGSPVPVVVDADGLFALGEGVGPIPARAPLVLTPHAGEYRRLAGRDPGPDRVGAARLLSDRTGAVVLVKGSTTAVATPAGDVLLGTSGSSVLATAGTGDVLSGVIGALVARGVTPLAAAGLGAHLHGRAAGLGPAEGLVAGDLPDAIGRFLAGVRSTDRQRSGIPRGGAAGGRGPTGRR